MVWISTLTREPVLEDCVHSNKECTWSLSDVQVEENKRVSGSKKTFQVNVSSCAPRSRDTEKWPLSERKGAIETQTEQESTEVRSVFSVVSTSKFTLSRKSFCKWSSPTYNIWVGKSMFPHLYKVLLRGKIKIHFWGDIFKLIKSFKIYCPLTWQFHH